MSDLQQAINKRVHGYQPDPYQDPDPYCPHSDPPVDVAPPKRMGWMKTKILKFGLGLLGKKLDGKKTYVAGAAFILLGMVGMISNMLPDQGLPKMDVVESWGYFAGGIALIGGGHKADKIVAALETGKEGA